MDYGVGADTTVFHLFDNPESRINSRKEIDPNYKHVREKRNVPQGFYETLELLHRVLQYARENSYILWAEGHEADDLTVLKEIGESESPRLFVSADLDWARNITEENHYFNYKSIQSASMFEEFYGFAPDPDSVILYKSLHGDVSDSIPPGCMYLPKELGAEIMRKVKTVDELENRVDDLPVSDYWKGKIKLSIPRIRKNSQLVNYHIPETYNVIKCRDNRKILDSIYSALSILLEDDKDEDKLF